MCCTCGSKKSAMFISAHITIEIAVDTAPYRLYCKSSTKLENCYCRGQKSTVYCDCRQITIPYYILIK